MISNTASYKVGQTYWFIIDGVKNHAEVIEKGVKKLRLKINGALEWYSTDRLETIDKKRFNNIVAEKPVERVHVDDSEPKEIPIPIASKTAKPKDILATELIDVTKLIKDENNESSHYLLMCFKRDVRFLLNKYGGAKTTPKDSIGQVLGALKECLL